MEEELKWLKLALTFDFGIIVGIVAWQGVLKAAMSFVNTKLKEWMEHALPTEQASLNKFLNSLGYRVFVFIVNAFLSIKLPVTARKGDRLKKLNLFEKQPPPKK